MSEQLAPYTTQPIRTTPPITIDLRWNDEKAKWAATVSYKIGTECIRKHYFRRDISELCREIGSDLVKERLV